MYVDAVRYTRTQPGRTDSVIAWWMYNLVSGKRHIIFLMRKAELCRCGCAGWCSYFAVWTFIRWSVERPAWNQPRAIRRAGQVDR